MKKADKDTILIIIGMVFALFFAIAPVFGK